MAQQGALDRAVRNNAKALSVGRLRTLRAFPGSNDKPIGNGIIDAAAAVSAAATY